MSRSTSPRACSGTRPMRAGSPRESPASRRSGRRSCCPRSADPPSLDDGADRDSVGVDAPADRVRTAALAGAGELGWNTVGAHAVRAVARAAVGAGGARGVDAPAVALLVPAAGVRAAIAVLLAGVAERMADVDDQLAGAVGAGPLAAV